MIRDQKLIQVVNYHTALKMLSFSLSKLEKNRDWLFDSVMNGVPLIQQPEISNRFQVTPDFLENAYRETESLTLECDTEYGVVTLRDAEYPKSLKEMKKGPPWFLFYRGFIELANTKCVSVVGSRHATPDGVRRAQRVSMLLSSAGYTVVSGLAKGIDTAAHSATLNCNGNTIAVIGTPINQSYPSENKKLQSRIANEHLLFSQFPIGQNVTRASFPTRNWTMCGLSQATVIVEAGETSGALYQADACIREGRQLFIMKSLLETSLTWPRKYVEKGAFVLETPEQLFEDLQKVANPANEAENGKSDDLRQLTLFG